MPKEARMSLSNPMEPKEIRAGPFAWEEEDDEILLAITISPLDQNY
jgi:hypothetical protein